MSFLLCLYVMSFLLSVFCSQLFDARVWLLQHFYWRQLVDFILRTNTWRPAVTMSWQTWYNILTNMIKYPHKHDTISWWHEKINSGKDFIWPLYTLFSGFQIGPFLVGSGTFTDLRFHSARFEDLRIGPMGWSVINKSSLYEATTAPLPNRLTQIYQ